jgi:molybdopterin-guanine dinucleotide biosynthesis protein A
LGEYGLHYLRTKDKIETDFLVTKNRKPWFLVEVTTKAKGISPALDHFQRETNAPHAFQVAFDLPFVNKSCFEERGLILVPAQTFLSQLV